MTFKDFITLQRGFDLPKTKMRPGAYPVIGSTSVLGYHDEFKVEPPGVVTGRSGSLGFVQYVPVKYWPHNTSLWVRDFKGNHPRYVYYYLQTLDLQRFNSGAGVPTLNRNDLDTLELWVHSLPTQRKIAAVLSAYDDLIENNTRRIQILEEMARAIYREWFVHFRFPGHETVKMVESAGGLIPDGWEVKRLGEACEIVMGQSPKSEFYNETGEGLPFHQGVKDFGQRFPTDRVYCTVQNRIAEACDILFSVRAPVGRINMANKRIVIGRGLCAIRDKNENQAFIFHQLKEKFQEEDIMGGGTIFKAVTKADMLGIHLLLPPQSFIARFEQIAKPIFSALANLTSKIKTSAAPATSFCLS
ncbi:restriction endonuclease subunit S [Candidatus Poribacteria bacterium]|nr:restriction endonuclease subunit S [Candidatus Poribacteria bacterium]